MRNMHALFFLLTLALASGACSVGEVDELEDDFFEQEAEPEPGADASDLSEEDLLQGAGEDDPIATQAACETRGSWSRWFSYYGRGNSAMMRSRSMRGGCATYCRRVASAIQSRLNRPMRGNYFPPTRSGSYGACYILDLNTW